MKFIRKKVNLNIENKKMKKTKFHKHQTLGSPRIINPKKTWKAQLEVNNVLKPSPQTAWAWIVTYWTPNGFGMGSTLYIKREDARQEVQELKGFDLDNVKISKVEIKILK